MLRRLTKSTTEHVLSVYFSVYDIICLLEMTDIFQKKTESFEAWKPKHAHLCTRARIQNAQYYADTFIGLLWDSTSREDAFLDAKGNYL